MLTDDKSASGAFEDATGLETNLAAGNIVEALNRKGLEGWEVIAVTNDRVSKTDTYLLKRPKQEE